MKIHQLLQEKLVNSSWLESVNYYGFGNKIFPGEELIVFRIKNNPKSYIVRGLTRKDFKDWLESPSKGKFYHYLKKRFRRDWFLSNPFRIIKY